MDDRDLEQAIAEGVHEHGIYHLTLDQPDAQRLVDIRWAALGAGRRLGRRLQMQVVYDEDLRGGVVITVTPQPDQ